MLISSSGVVEDNRFGEGGVGVELMGEKKEKMLSVQRQVKEMCLLGAWGDATALLKS